MPPDEPLSETRPLLESARFPNSGHGIGHSIYSVHEVVRQVVWSRYRAGTALDGWSWVGYPALELRGTLRQTPGLESTCPGLRQFKGKSQPEERHLSSYAHWCGAGRRHPRYSSVSNIWKHSLAATDASSGRGRRIGTCTVTWRGGIFRAQERIGRLAARQASLVRALHDCIPACCCAKRCADVQPTEVNVATLVASRSHGSRVGTYSPTRGEASEVEPLPLARQAKFRSSGWTKIDDAAS